MKNFCTNERTYDILYYVFKIVCRFLDFITVSNILQLCVHVHNHPAMDTPVDAQEMVLVSPMIVTEDMVLLVTAGDGVLLMLFGREVLQLVRKVGFNNHYCANCDYYLIGNILINL